MASMLGFLSMALCPSREALANLGSRGVEAMSMACCCGDDASAGTRFSRRRFCRKSVVRVNDALFHSTSFTVRGCVWCLSLGLVITKWFHLMDSRLDSPFSSCAISFFARLIVSSEKASVLRLERGFGGSTCVFRGMSIHCFLLSIAIRLVIHGLIQIVYSCFHCGVGSQCPFPNERLFGNLTQNKLPCL